MAAEAVSRTEWIQRPHLPLRLAAAVLSLAIIALTALMVIHIRQFQFNDYTNFIQALEASISSVVFIGAAILFFVSWENRIKRRRGLKAVHELRALAHIVDMHQLTKDPESYFSPIDSGTTTHGRRKSGRPCGVNFQPARGSFSAAARQLGVAPSVISTR